MGYDTKNDHRWQRKENVCVYSKLCNFMEQNPSSEIDRRSAGKEIPTLYGSKSFSTVFTRACHWTLSWATLIQSTPLDPVTLSFIVISSHLCPYLLSGFFLSCWLKLCMHFLFLPCVIHVQHTISSLIWSPVFYQWSHTNESVFEILCGIW